MVIGHLEAQPTIVRVCQFRALSFLLQTEILEMASEPADEWGFGEELNVYSSKSHFEADFLDVAEFEHRYDKGNNEYYYCKQFDTVRCPARLKLRTVTSGRNRNPDSSVYVSKKGEHSGHQIVREFEDDSKSKFNMSHFKLPRVKNPEEVVWMRPHELCSSPQFVREGISPEDAVQGRLADCSLISCLTSLAATPRPLKKKFFQQICGNANDTKKQGFGRDYTNEKYKGRFLFNFYVQETSKWEIIIVDDRLPTLNQELIYGKADAGEFWLPITEKAFCKFIGCKKRQLMKSYASIEEGLSIRECLIALTGGTVHTYRPRRLGQPQRSNPERFISAHKRTADVMVAAIDKGHSKKGLEDDHAYSIDLTRIEEVTQTDGKKITLVLLKNPWASGEWEGPWSDYDHHWQLLSDDDRERLLGDVSGNNGKFWMEDVDVYEHFDELNALSGPYNRRVKCKMKVALCSPEYATFPAVPLPNSQPSSVHDFVLHATKWRKQVCAANSSFASPAQSFAVNINTKSGVEQRRTADNIECLVPSAWRRAKRRAAEPAGHTALMLDGLNRDKRETSH